MLGTIGLLGGYLDKRFSKDSRITMILMVALATLVFEIGKYIISIAMFSIPIEILGFMKLLLIEVLFNVILTIILQPIIKKLGYYAENVFKNNNVLTRYF